MVDPGEPILAAATGLVLARALAELGLCQLNRRHIRAHADAVPAPFRDRVEAPVYARSVQYTLARNRFNQTGILCHTLVLLAVLLSGVLPRALDWTLTQGGPSAWSMAALLFFVALALTLPDLPLDWFEQFRLEQRFGFNTSTQKTWWLDRLKALLLAAALGYPLLVLILTIVEWTGSLWWLWAWAAVMGFQLLMSVLAPVLILPLFNKLTPLAAGSLKERLTALARRTRFKTRDIVVMDGSRRSRHSNAFFTGFGRLRRVVLFDTLLGQLTDEELEAVLAHEIGHYKKRHIPKMLAGAALGSLAGFAALAWLAGEPRFVEAFGFAPPSAEAGTAAAAMTPALLLFGLLAGAVTFWLSPIVHALTRRYEYEADAFARTLMDDARPLIAALRKLNETNLSNLTPHPLYSGFHDSHPTLLQREAALTRPTGSK